MAVQAGEVGGEARRRPGGGGVGAAGLPPPVREPWLSQAALSAPRGGPGGAQPRPQGPAVCWDNIGT